MSEDSREQLKVPSTSMAASEGILPPGGRAMGDAITGIKSVLAGLQEQIPRREVFSLSKCYERLPKAASVELVAPSLGGCNVVGVYIREADGVQHVFMVHNPFETNAESSNDLRGLFAQAAIPIEKIVAVEIGVCVAGAQGTMGVVPEKPGFYAQIGQTLHAAFPGTPIKENLHVYLRRKAAKVTASGKVLRAYANGSYTMRVQAGQVAFTYQQGV